MAADVLMGNDQDAAAGSGRTASRRPRASSGATRRIVRATRGGDAPARRGGGAAAD